jgi:hypothetical protein
MFRQYLHGFDPGGVHGLARRSQIDAMGRCI